MNSAQAIIQNVGLSENAAKIYLALLQKGRGNYSSLATATGLHPQSVKNGLRELADRRYVIRLDHKLTQTLWRPIPPYEISKRLHQRYEAFASQLPSLQKLFRQHPATLVRVSPGMDETLGHLGRLIETTRAGHTITFFGTGWNRLATEKPGEWTALENQAKQRRIRFSRLSTAAQKSRGPISVAASGRGAVMYIYDPTESIAITIQQPRAAQQLAALFV